MGKGGGALKRKFKTFYLSLCVPFANDTSCDCYLQECHWTGLDETEAHSSSQVFYTRSVLRQDQKKKLFAMVKKLGNVGIYDHCENVK